MATTEEIRHDLLLAITVALTLLLTTGLAGPPKVGGGTPIVFP